jgi:hypothetical protein
MSRALKAALAAVLVCALVPAAAGAQAPTTPMTKKVQLTGTKGFKGTYTIDRFIAKGNQLYAVGDVTGKLKGKKVTKRNVRIPAALATGAQAAQIPPIPNACQVLNLTLGPINLNLLGLSVRTNQIDLRIEAIPGAGNLLGNLLCAITNLLNPSAAPPSQIAQALNAILALLSR